MESLVPVDDVLEGELIEDHNDCQLAYNGHCTNTDVQLVEDPYQADINNNPGQLIWTCPECLDELSDAV